MKGKEVLRIKNKRTKVIVGWLSIILVLFVGVLLTNNQAEKHETVTEMMRDAVMHDVNKISLFGIMDVNPGLISAAIVTTIMLTFALIIRLFAIPKFKRIPGKFQLILEEMVGLFDKFAKKNSPHRNGFLAYIFGAGMYIFLEPCLNYLAFKLLPQRGTPSPFQHLFRI